MFAELLGKEAGYCQRQGRLDAHRRPRERQPGRQRHRRRQRRHCHGRGLCRQDAEERPRGRLFLRRRGAGPGPALRGHEHGVALAAARAVRVREQPVQRIHLLQGDRRRRPAGPPACFWDSCRGGGWAGRARGERGRTPPDRPVSQRRGPGLPLVSHLSLFRPPCGRHQPRVLSPQGRRGALEIRTRPHRTATHLVCRDCGRPRGTTRRYRREGARRDRRRGGIRPSGRPIRLHTR